MLPFIRSEIPPAEIARVASGLARHTGKPYDECLRELQQLSIKRLDRAPIHDWRELQTIKNVIVGTENEAVELYPAESRCVDTANQYHLWCLVDASARFPFGYQDRLVTDRDLLGTGSVQRPMGGA